MADPWPITCSAVLLAGFSLALQFDGLGVTWPSDLNYFRSMYYRLSNTAERKQMEEEFGLPFKYPGLYHPNPVINGLNEATLPVITMDEDSKINFAIWGMLPQMYQDDWAIFQNIFNTLNLTRESFDDGVWHSKLITNCRCLIIASGFFTAFLQDGEVYPYYVYAEGHRPFTLAGLYSQLEDGFITTSLLLGYSSGLISRIHNVDRLMPLIIKPSMRDIWLDRQTHVEQVMQFIRHPELIALKAHPITKEFFRSEANHRNLLEPVHYYDIPFAP